MSTELDYACQSLEQWFQGRTIARVETEAGAKLFRGCDLGLLHSLNGRLSNVSKRGPGLLLKFSSALWLSVQLGDAARFLKRSPSDEVKASRLRLTLDDGTVVHLQDHQQLSRVSITPSQSSGVLDVSRRAPSVHQLQAALHQSNQELKVALRDPERLVGLSCERVDEVLFHAKLHPERAPATLSPADWQGLVRAMASTEGPLLIAGAPCPRCGALLSALKQGGEETSFCASCQPKRKPVEGDQLRKKPRPRRYRG